MHFNSWNEQHKLLVVLMFYVLNSIYTDRYAVTKVLEVP